jgi:ATP-binding cassette subfamily B protein
VHGAQNKQLQLEQLHLDSLRKLAHLVPQESFLFSTSIRENLLLVQPTANDDALWAALDAAAAKDMVENLADGLDTLIGERGTTLSGGQKQRLCLARAFLAQPRLLLLDDATSALDSSTERRVLGHIVARDTSVLMSASRLSTVLCADQVIWLEAGRIRAIDHHENLALDHQAYRTLMGLHEEVSA